LGRRPGDPQADVRALGVILGRDARGKGRAPRGLADRRAGARPRPGRALLPDRGDAVRPAGGGGEPPREEPPTHVRDDGGLPGASRSCSLAAGSPLPVAELLGGAAWEFVYRGGGRPARPYRGLKSSPRSSGAIPIAQSALLTEARAASALEDANLCTVLDVGETEEGMLFLACLCTKGERAWSAGSPAAPWPSRKPSMSRPDRAGSPMHTRRASSIETSNRRTCS